MDGSFTDYVNNQVLNAYFGGTTITPPATLYFGLSTRTLQKNSVGATPTEPNDLYYTRVAITNNSTNFPNASAGIKTCFANINWPAPRKDWGNIKAVFIADASGIAGGNLLEYYNLTTQITVNSGDIPLVIASGAFQKVFT